jgi:hypothetical protein
MQPRVQFRPAYRFRIVLGFGLCSTSRSSGFLKRLATDLTRWWFDAVPSGGPGSGPQPQEPPVFKEPGVPFKLLLPCRPVPRDTLNSKHRLFLSTCGGAIPPSRERDGILAVFL